MQGMQESRDRRNAVGSIFVAGAVSQHRVGLLLVTAAAVAWSTAPFFTRLLAFDAWTILFWRGLFGGSLIIAFLLMAQGRDGPGHLLKMERSSWLVALLSTLGMVSFIPALQLTSVANVAVINAAGPFVAAALAWALLREAAQPRTLLASLVALIGIAIIIGSGHAAADMRGIILACIMTLAIAGMTVTVRRYKHTSMVAAAAVSNFLGSLVGLPFAQGILRVTEGDVVVFALFGFCQVALGLTLFVLGSRYLPSGQASLIATLETPLMPFWIWLAFDEVPTYRELVGGTLVLGAVIVDIIGDARSLKSMPLVAAHPEE
jgi:drug/metabolite transporter (DMT)-like permease